MSGEVQRRGDWVQLASGRVFWPLDPRPDDVYIDDIAHSLSLQTRFCGHCRVHYPIASHCVLVSNIVPPQDALWGLLHDASEAYLADIPRPLKQLPEFKVYREIEDNLMRVICQVYGLDPVIPESVIKADTIALATEARDLMAPPKKEWTLSEKPLPGTIVVVDSKTAKKQFLDRYTELVNARFDKFSHG